MSRIGHDGGPAFGSMGKLQKHEYGRRSESVSYVPEGGQEGMSLRDYFAAHAPITGPDANQSLRRSEYGQFAKPDEHGVYPFPLIMKELIRLRWEYADAMLAAREGSRG